jgi:SAM-dependent methyltransferase
MSFKTNGFHSAVASDRREARGIERKYPLTAKIEPFDSFWEGPKDIAAGYRTLGQFYRANYRKHLPHDRSSRILVVSCGPGYFVNFLAEEGYRNVLGIDSDSDKVAHAWARGLSCEPAEAFAYLEEHPGEFDLIFCESEINHLTKHEVLQFLQLCKEALMPGGSVIFHSMNGANPITGAEGLALNFDHYNTFTEYSMRQVLGHTGFRGIEVFPLRLYVFYKNPLNYVGMVAESLLNLAFRLSFVFYGKSNRIFTKKIAAIGRKGHE